MPPSSSGPISVQPYAPEHAPAFLRLLNLARGQDTALESFLGQDAAWPASQIRQRAMAMQEGVAVGMVELRHFDYLPLGWLLLTLVVDPASRHQSSGAGLYRWAEHQAATLGADGLGANVLDDDPDSREWAVRRGFTLRAHRFASELNLLQTQPAPELPLGVTIRDMTGATPAEWERLVSLYGDLLMDTPDMFGQPRWAPEQLRAHTRDNPRARPDWTLLAVSETGETLGLCQGVQISMGIYNEFTGVIPAARGQGLARALKLELIRRAQAAGVLLMRTNNHAANGPMLSMNNRLCFVQLSGSWEMRRALGDETDALNRQFT